MSYWRTPTSYLYLVESKHNGLEAKSNLKKEEAGMSTELQKDIPAQWMILKAYLGCVGISPIEVCLTSILKK